jgi:cobalamin synthase
MTAAEPNDRAAPEERRAATADLSWMLWTAIGIGGIWVAVVLISLFAPDLVSGSEQEHLPIAAFITWFWGVVGTLVLLWAMSRLRGSAMRRPVWIGLSVVTLALWAVATILAITLPVFETGTDPTQIPLGAMFASVGAAILTALAGLISNILGEGPGADGWAPRGDGRWPRSDR